MLYGEVVSKMWESLSIEDRRKILREIKNGEEKKSFSVRQFSFRDFKELPTNIQEELVCSFTLEGFSIGTTQVISSEPPEIRNKNSPF